MLVLLALLTFLVSADTSLALASTLLLPSGLLVVLVVFVSPVRRGSLGDLLCTDPSLLL